MAGVVDVYQWHLALMVGWDLCVYRQRVSDASCWETIMFSSCGFLKETG